MACGAAVSRAVVWGGLKLCVLEERAGSAHVSRAWIAKHSLHLLRALCGPETVQSVLFKTI